MTSRERWTVYPLLFLAIGLAMRVAMIPPPKLEVEWLEAGRIFCGEIVVTANDGTKLVHIGRVEGGGGGRIEIADRSGHEAVAIGTGSDSREGTIDFFDTNGTTIGILDATVLEPAAP